MLAPPSIPLQPGKSGVVHPAGGLFQGQDAVLLVRDRRGRGAGLFDDREFQRRVMVPRVVLLQDMLHVDRERIASFR